MGPASQGAFGVQAGAELTSESHRLWSALTETSHATATRFSRLVRLGSRRFLGRRLACLVDFHRSRDTIAARRKAQLTRASALASKMDAFLST